MFNFTCHQTGQCGLDIYHLPQGPKGVSWHWRKQFQYFAIFFIFLPICCVQDEEDTGPRCWPNNLYYWLIIHSASPGYQGPLVTGLLKLWVKIFSSTYHCWCCVVWCYHPQSQEAWRAHHKDRKLHWIHWRMSLYTICKISLIEILFGLLPISGLKILGEGLWSLCVEPCSTSPPSLAT